MSLLWRECLPNTTNTMLETIDFKTHKLSLSLLCNPHPETFLFPLSLFFSLFLSCVCVCVCVCFPPPSLPHTPTPLHSLFSLVKFDPVFCFRKPSKDQLPKHTHTFQDNIAEYVHTLPQLLLDHHCHYSCVL